MSESDERTLPIEQYIGMYSGCPMQGDRDSFSHLNHYLHFTAEVCGEDNLFSNRSFKGKKVLDIGSGEGFGSYFFYLGGARVTGVDLAPEVVKYSQEKYNFEGVEFQLADATCLPFENETFDFVVGMDLIEHVPDVEALSREVRRVLKPSGAAYMLTPNCLVSLVRRGKIYPFHVREFTTRSFRKLIDAEFPNSQFFTESHSHLKNVGERLRERDFLTVSLSKILFQKLKAFIKGVVPSFLLDYRRKRFYEAKYNAVSQYRFSLEEIKEGEFSLDEYSTGLDQCGLNFIFLYKKPSSS